MADDDVQDQEQQAAIEVAEGSGGGSKTVIIMIVLSVFVMVLTPIITVFAVKQFMPKPEAVTKPDKDKIFIDNINGLNVNVKDTNAQRFLSCDIVIEYNRKDMASFFQPRTPENTKGILYKIKAEIINILSDQNLTKLTASGGKKKLTDEIKRMINNELHEKTEGTINNVYFSKFLIQ